MAAIPGVESLEALFADEALVPVSPRAAPPSKPAEPAQHELPSFVDDEDDLDDHTTIMSREQRKELQVAAGRVLDKPLRLREAPAARAAALEATRGANPDDELEATRTDDSNQAPTNPPPGGVATKPPPAAGVAAKVNEAPTLPPFLAAAASAEARPVDADAAAKPAELGRELPDLLSMTVAEDDALRPPPDRPAESAPVASRPVPPSVAAPKRSPAVLIAVIAIVLVAGGVAAYLAMR